MNLYYYGFRYYSPEMGRWVNRDPIGEYGGLNHYVFGPNNPVQGYDYLGADWGGVKSTAGKIWRAVTKPLDDLGNDFEIKFGEAVVKVQEFLDREFKKIQKDTKKRFSTTDRIRYDIVDTTLLSLWVGGDLTLSGDECCLSVSGKPKATLLLKSTRFYGFLQVVGGLSGSLPIKWKSCNSNPSEWSLLDLSVSGKIGVRGSPPDIAKKVPGIRSVFVEGGVHANLNVDLLEGWASRTYSYGWYAQASVRVGVGKWNLDKIWGVSSGDFDYF